MPAQVLLYSYLAAAIAAIVLLVVFRARRWYWHIISLAIGLAVGLYPPPGKGGSNLFYLATGVVCVFCIFWGLGAPFFPRRAK